MNAGNEGVVNLVEKQTYYIAVGPGLIMEDKEASAFDFEIKATPEELDQLQELFQMENFEEAPVYLHARSPKDLLNIGAAAFKPYKESEAHEEYDHHLAAIYGLLHKLGTPETKQHIESMHILEKQ
jgi:hypothetical protein